ncbi:helix-turn-helix domain-containing protein [Halovenus salina]|uniref:Helix-turn-helix domain-containing protein n=1 Tax=Halovenus salina TaxID=1510225 RepID=A0ABD5W5J0_9EURY|nr:helix-turn-helix domain-containing protein [Halovenus salina]
MRYATVILSWERGQLHALDDAVATTSDVHIETTHFINPLEDGTHVELAQFRGNMETLSGVFEHTSGVLDYEVPTEDDGFAYVHYESTPMMEALFTAIFEHTIVLQWPLEFVDDSQTRGIRITFMGSEAALTNVTREIPNSLDLSLVRTGEYTKAHSDPTLALSDKQRILLETALEAGYYEIPRETTQEELADKLGVTHATISDRLQRLESTLLNSLLPSVANDDL